MRKLVIDALIFENQKAYGYQEYLFNLLDYFFKNRNSLNFDIINIACSNTQEGAFERFSTQISIIGFDVSSRIKLILAQNRLKTELKLNHDDLILYTYNYSSFIKQAKSVLVIHDLLYLRKKLLHNWLMRMQRMLFVPRSLYNADKIIAISEFTSSDIQENYNVRKDKISVIYNYFNFEKFKLDVNESSDLDTKRFFLSVSSVLPHKNIITILKAYSLVCSHDPNCPDLIFVGNRANLNLECRTFFEIEPDQVIEKIHFRQHVSNSLLAELYKKCECFILSTLFEGLGMPIVEALYFSAKIVLSDIPVCHEVAGSSAMYFNPTDHAQLAEILLTKKYKHLVVDQKELEKFKTNNTSQKYINLLNSF